MRQAAAPAAAEQMEVEKDADERDTRAVDFPNEKRHWLVKQDSQAERTRFYSREYLRS